MSGKSNGQRLLETIEAYISRYVCFPAEPAGQPLVVALWVLHTWIYEHFGASPYLVVTAATKRAGKTLLLEVIQSICRGGELLATLRAPAMCRLIEAADGAVTCLFDESEKLSGGAAGDARSLLTSGYLSGSTHAVSVGTKVKKMRTYCPKGFALIGDVMDVLRDRAIVVTLERGIPEANYRADRLMGATGAAHIVSMIKEGFAAPVFTLPETLTGRDQEIWTALYSIAVGLNLDAATMERLDRAMTDLVAMKTAERKVYTNLQDAEADAMEIEYSEKAIKDLAAVIREGESAIWTAVAIERMKELPTAPWRTFKGEGLTEMRLAALVKPFVSASRSPVRMGKDRKQARGYRAADVRKAIAALGAK